RRRPPFHGCRSTSHSRGVSPTSRAQASVIRSGSPARRKRKRMRNLRELDYCRIMTPEAAERNHPDIAHVSGAFLVKPDPKGPTFIVHAANGDGWDHVSVSTRDRCPTWPEMDAIKRMFFKSGEVAMQLHVAEDDHISVHPYTLHLWRPHGSKRPIPLPPKEF